jgi:hypothetical protein
MSTTGKFGLSSQQTITNTKQLTMMTIENLLQWQMTGSVIPMVRALWQQQLLLLNLCFETKKLL